MNARYQSAKRTRSDPKPYWGYEDIGAFGLLLVLLNLILRLLVRVHLLAPVAAAKPSTLTSACSLVSCNRQEQLSGTPNGRPMTWRV